MNGGFRLNVGAGGFESFGRTAAPLGDGLGSVVTYTDGTTDIGSWHHEVPAPGRTVASVRQNLPLLIDHGTAASTLDCLSCWGATLGGVIGEYVTSHMFDITEQRRNLGGHLAFLPANDFFREVVISGASMTLIGRFWDLGRPEAALIGAQYIDWYRNRYPNQLTAWWAPAESHGCSPAPA